MLVIEANKIQKNYFKDLCCYRELFYFFAWRDILVRYKQAVFGILWALIRPLLNMGIFAFLFGKIAHFPSDNIPYPLFVLAGLLPWQLFSNSVNEGCLSLLNNAQLISKVYFPRMIIPVAQIIVHFIDFFISLALLFLLGILWGTLSWHTLLALPFFIILTGMLCIGTSLLLSALTMQYRDIRFLVPFFVQFGLFISPVGYGSFIIQTSLKWLFFLNPLVGIIDGFRWAFFGISHPDILYTVSFSVLITLGVLLSGFYFFRKIERTFADKM